MHNSSRRLRCCLARYTSRTRKAACRVVARALAAILRRLPVPPSACWKPGCLEYSSRMLGLSFMSLYSVPMTATSWSSPTDKILATAGSGGKMDSSHICCSTANASGVGMWNMRGLNSAYMKHAKQHQRATTAEPPSTGRGVTICRE
eukprot:GHRQ01025947.1.p2 GENE.GHRQ01025947.1~~GHRQ01025947.1.p2  ORF type:complete len:147 (+),score=22.55 GHRQ01025947.1:313-753(+)